MLTVLFSITTTAQYRFEIGGFGGVTSYLGDANQNTPLMYANEHYGGVLRYNSSYRVAIKTAISSGSVTIPSFTYRTVLNEKKNLSIIDAAITGEYNFYPYSKTLKEGSAFSPYLFGGVGFAIIENTQSVTPNLPFGVGFKYKITDIINFELEAGMRKMFTDKTDQITNSDFNSSALINNDYYTMIGASLTFSFSKRQWRCCNDNGEMKFRKQ